MVKVGLISDTHGYLDPAIPKLFLGVDLVLHAGDVGSLAIIEGLRDVAEVKAVRGNIDERGEAASLPLCVELTLDGLRVHLVHELDRRRIPTADVVVYGHSHRTFVGQHEGRLLVNPGAAGRRGFHRVFSVGFLDIIEGKASARIVELGVRPVKPAVPARP